MIRIISVAIFLSLLSLVHAISVAAQDSSQSKPREVESLMNAFLDVLTSEERPGGLILLEKNCNGEEMAKQPKLPNGPLDAQLDFLAKTNSDYRIVDDSKVLNLVPTDYEPEILKAHVSDFVVDSDLSLSLSLQRLLALDELKDKVNDAGLNTGLQIMIGGSGPKSGGPRRVKHLTNMNLQETLNSIAVFYQHAAWIYSETKCKGKERTVLQFVRR